MRGDTILEGVLGISLLFDVTVTFSNPHNQPGASTEGKGFQEDHSGHGAVAMHAHTHKTGGDETEAEEDHSMMSYSCCGEDKFFGI